MWLNQLFTDYPIDFEKRCKTRIKVGIGVVILGGISIGMIFLANGIPAILYLEENSREFVFSFYSSFGIALIAAGLVLITKNVRYLKNPSLRKKREIAETDERNRLLGLRCWAYAGYSLFLLLYSGVLISGFISMMALMILQIVIALYAFLLLFFRFLLGRLM